MPDRRSNALVQLSFQLRRWLKDLEPVWSARRGGLINANVAELSLEEGCTDHFQVESPWRSRGDRRHTCPRQCR
jgi:hypothetical protein